MFSDGYTPKPMGIKIVKSPKLLEVHKDFYLH